jgi:hypothetical protein
MVFNRKGNFFLNLDEKAPEKPATVAPVTAPKAADAKRPSWPQPRQPAPP